eukprot:2279231-Amphidinium_carterae.1
MGISFTRAVTASFSRRSVVSRCSSVSCLCRMRMLFHLTVNPNKGVLTVFIKIFSLLRNRNSSTQLDKFAVEVAAATVDPQAAGYDPRALRGGFSVRVLDVSHLLAEPFRSSI